MKGSERSVTVLCVRLDMIYDFIGVKYQKIEKSKERIGTYKDKLGTKKYEELIDFFRDDINKLEKLLGYKTGWV